MARSTVMRKLLASRAFVWFWDRVWARIVAAVIVAGIAALFIISLLVFLSIVGLVAFVLLVLALPFLVLYWLLRARTRIPAQSETPASEMVLDLVRCPSCGWSGAFPVGSRRPGRCPRCSGRLR